MTIGDVASIATLVLFVLYTAGRAWTLVKNKAFMREDFFIDPSATDKEYEDSDNYIDLSENEYSDIVKMISPQSKPPAFCHPKGAARRIFGFLANQGFFAATLPGIVYVMKNVLPAINREGRFVMFPGNPGSGISHFTGK